MTMEILWSIPQEVLLAMLKAVEEGQSTAEEIMAHLELTSRQTYYHAENDGTLEVLSQEEAFEREREEFFTQNRCEFCGGQGSIEGRKCIICDGVGVCVDEVDW